MQSKMVDEAQPVNAALNGEFKILNGVKTQSVSQSGYVRCNLLACTFIIHKIEMASNEPVRFSVDHLDARDGSVSAYALSVWPDGSLSLFDIARHRFFLSKTVPPEPIDLSLLVPGATFTILARKYTVRAAPSLSVDNATHMLIIMPSAYHETGIVISKLEQQPGVRIKRLQSAVIDSTCAHSLATEGDQLKPADFTQDMVTVAELTSSESNIERVVKLLK
jgi:hypothetical protein